MGTILEKKLFLKYLDSTKATGHLLIASLALLSSKGLNIVPLYSDGSKGPVFQIKPSDLLRQLNYFPVDTLGKRLVYDLKPAIPLIEEGSPDREKSILLLFNIAITIPIVRAFECIKEYCANTKQEDKFCNQEWFLVARVIRNCFSHDFNLKIKDPKTLSKLPITWKNITITKEMLGKPIEPSDISYINFAELLKAMIEFGNEID